MIVQRGKVHRNGPDPMAQSLSIFEADIVLRDQWESRRGGMTRMQPERHLMLGVLEQAVRDILAGVRRRSIVDNSYWRYLLEDYRSAMAWVEDDDETWPMSFLPVCAAVGFDAGLLRSTFRGWVEDPDSAPAEFYSLDIARRERMSDRKEKTLSHPKGGAMGGLTPLAGGIE